jgi:hypothetical protein
MRAGVSSAGIFSLAACGTNSLIAVGGDYTKPQATDGTGAYSHDAGATWTPVSGLSGYRSAVHFLNRKNCQQAIATGTNGSDVTLDGGAHWERFSGENFSVLAAVDNEFWAAGPQGRVARLTR